MVTSLGEYSVLKFDGCVSAIGARANRDFNPGKQLCVAAGRIVVRGVVGAAIQLLPHLVEAMHRAGGIGVVGECIAVGQLEGPAGSAFTFVMRASGVSEVWPVPPVTR